MWRFAIAGWYLALKLLWRHYNTLIRTLCQFECDSPMWQSDVAVRCDILMWHSYMTVPCDSPMWWVDMTFQCDTPMWHSGVTFRCDILMWHSDVTIRYDISMWQSDVTDRVKTHWKMSVVENGETLQRPNSGDRFYCSIPEALARTKKRCHKKQRSLEAETDNQSTLWNNMRP